MRCNKFLKDLDCFADDELSEEKKRHLLEHLNTCPSCMEQYKLTLLIKEATSQGEESPEGLAGRVVGAVEKAGPVSVERRRRFYPMPVTLAMAAVLALFFGLSGGKLDQLIGVAEVGISNTPAVASPAAPPAGNSELLPAIPRTSEENDSPSEANSGQQPVPPSEKGEGRQIKESPKDTGDGSEQSPSENSHGEENPAIVEQPNSQIIPPDMADPGEITTTFDLEEDEEGAALRAQYDNTFTVRLTKEESEQQAIEAGFVKKLERNNAVYLVGSFSQLQRLSYNNFTPPKDKSEGFCLLILILE